MYFEILYSGQVTALYFSLCSCKYISHLFNAAETYLSSLITFGSMEVFSLFGNRSEPSARKRFPSPVQCTYQTFLLTSFPGSLKTLFV